MQHTGHVDINFQINVKGKFVLCQGLRIRADLISCRRPREVRLRLLNAAAHCCSRNVAGTPQGRHLAMYSHNDISDGGWDIPVYISCLPRDERLFLTIRRFA